MGAQEKTKSLSGDWIDEDLDDEGDEMYCLSPWGCLMAVLADYKVDVSSISGRVGTHIVEDFMESLEKQGYLTKVD